MAVRATPGRVVTPRVVAFAAILTVVSACTTPEPEAAGPAPAPPEEAPAQPPVGMTVGVVLPPATDVDPDVLAAMRSDVARLGTSLGPEIRELRTFTPEDPTFVRDLAAMLADRGTDLVCVVGEWSWRGILELADLHPELRFCAAAVTSDADRPDSVGLIEVRAAELGHVVGVAAREAAGTSGSVGLVLGGDELPADAFHDGLLAGLEGAEVLEPELGENVTEVVDGLLEAGATVVVTDGGPGAAQAIAQAHGRAVVLGPAAVVDAAGGGVAALSWQVRWDIVLRQQVTALLGSGPEGPTSYGLAEGVFAIRVRRSAGDAVRRVVESTTEALSDGSRDPLEQAAGAPKDRVQVDEDDERDQGDETDESSDADDGEAGERTGDTSGE